MDLKVPPFVAGLVGGVLGWLVTQFIAEPLRRFFGLRRDIAQRLLDYENVRAPRDERGGVTEEFSEQHAVRLGDAQKKLREFSTQTLSFVQTDALATYLLQRIWRYDLTKADRSLLGLSNTIAARAPSS